MTTDTRHATTPKKPAKKESAAAALKRLAAGAESLKKKSGSKKGGVVNHTPKKKPAKRAKVDEIIPPAVAIVPAKGEVEEIMARCVKTSRDNTSLTLDPETTTGEYVRIFDNITGYAEKFQLLIGDLILAGEKLKSFAGQYPAIMAASGRSVSTLKQYRSTALHTPKALRLLPYTHLHACVKIPAIEDKETVIKEVAKKAKDTGKMPTVPEVKKMADKFKARNPNKGKKKPAKASKTARVTRDLTVDENGLLDEMEDTAAKLESQIGAASFLLEAKSDATSTLREKLGSIARFHAQLSE